MKRNRIIAITTGTFMTLASVLTIVSCSKNENVPVSSDVNKASYSKISAVTDLEHFQTQFLNSEDGSQTVVFSEADDIPFLPQDARRLGFESLTISKGLYEIKTDTKGHSKVTFAVRSASGMGSEMSVGIRIADRYKTKCGTTYGEFYCVCGIGFRCGIVSGLDEPMAAESIETSIYPEKDANGNITGLTFDFQRDNIDWKAIDGN